ncbi:hypothetical protein [Paenibacillus macerans]|uniref:hypothetical protein n=1 Tax=Paenibacillus macerans TaxID=44252 RepID=UPI00203CA0A5|nr:hypothetical protein [Paenibacillus macerans]MCM3699872.1 hypothetical protein [Paenibacillus macerans]
MEFYGGDHQRPFLNSLDEEVAKLKFKEKEQRLLNEGVRGVFREAVNLLITVGILALIFALFIAF